MKFPLLSKSCDEINSLKLQNEALTATLLRRDETIKEYEDKLKELVFENSELEELLEQKQVESAKVEVRCQNVATSQYKRKLKA